MRRHSSKNSLSSLSDLNVTPLLDLSFVLLIIFMITAPFLAESADLIIPTSKASRDAVDPSKVYTVSVDRHGNLGINDKPVSDKEVLKREILTIRKNQPELAILVRSHQALPVQTLVELMDIFKESGVTKVGVVTRSAGAEDARVDDQETESRAN